MTLNEIRFYGLIAFAAATGVAILATLVIAAVARIVRHVDGDVTRALPSLRGDARADADRVVDRRQAMWRLRC